MQWHKIECPVRCTIYESVYLSIFLCIYCIFLCIYLCMHAWCTHEGMHVSIYVTVWIACMSRKNKQTSKLGVSSPQWRHWMNKLPSFFILHPSLPWPYPSLWYLWLLQAPYQRWSPPPRSSHCTPPEENKQETRQFGYQVPGWDFWEHDDPPNRTNSMINLKNDLLSTMSLFEKKLQFPFQKGLQQSSI